MEPIDAVAENLLRSMQFFGQAPNGGEIQGRPGVGLVSCGLNFPAYNAAVLARPFEGGADAFARLIQAADSFFAAKTFPWTCYVCDDYFERPAAPESRRALERSRLSIVAELPGMYAERLAPPAADLPDVEIQAVEDAVTRRRFAGIASAAFGFPAPVSSAFFESERAWKGELRGFVGYRSGEPVSALAAIVAGGAVGFYLVATAPAQRRRGYAEASMRRVLDSVSRSTGIERTVLQSSRSGYRLYKKMGYRLVTNFSVYLSERPLRTSGASLEAAG
jgi:hypothetical protein